MANYTRKSYTRTSDGRSLVKGNLISGNLFQYEEYDKEKRGVSLKELKLLDSATGEAVAGREPGNALIVGFFGDNGTFKTEWICPIVSDLNTYEKVPKHDENPLYVFASTNLSDISDEVSESGKAYKKLKFRGGNNTTIILKAFYDFREMPENGLYVFTTTALECKKSKFEKDGEEVEWRTFYGLVQCQLV